MQQESQTLEENLIAYAHAVREFGKRLPVTLANVEDLRQLVKASGALGSRYIQANGAATRQDFVHGIRTCGAEARNSWYWLRLVDTQGTPELETQRERLLRVSLDLELVFAKILKQSLPG
ncbi:MAG: four helix bundle protein [Bacteroidia bacterium]|nr:four helix bundle protein [Bacteroidia bacterium]